jgi:signal transduction histidine kinase
LDLKWFAGSLAWIKDPARILKFEDATFLAAFGSCIMAEKSKMDALSADRAKSDFISSVSHELRSPLHGILATVEVLADTAMTMEQNDLIRTVSTCGELLMDTVDHILDYAKLSNSKKLRRLATGEAEEMGQRSSRSIKITTFDLSNLVECVVEGIFAGHNFRSLVNADSAAPERVHRTQQQRAVRLTPPSMNPNVMVIVDIERQLNWLFDSQIGAWKRILTNLFGNALKYTEAGFIRVSLSAVPMPSRPNSFVITLEIQDSGIGMSKDYIKHRLYTPFAQVNPMSVGTGLGLSIVRQLINDLDGTIDIESEVGYGTWVKVSIPSSISSSDQPDEQSIGSTAKIRDIKVWCVGLKIYLVGFDYYPEIEEAPTGILSAHARRMLAIRSSMSTLLAEWFGMEVATAPSLDEAKGDILVGMQSQINLIPKPNRAEPLIVFEDCYSGFRAENEVGVFHLSQP